MLIRPLLSYQRTICTSKSSLGILQTTEKKVTLQHASTVLHLQRHAKHKIHWSKQKVSAQTTQQLSRVWQVDLIQTDGERERERQGGRRGGRNADYLRKQAASEEVGQPATLTGDSCTDLRRDGGKMRWDGFLLSFLQTVLCCSGWQLLQKPLK